MALKITKLTPEDALTRGVDAFEVTLYGWGYSSDDSYPQVPLTSFPFTPYGLVIGPRSTVDRCWVSWNTQQNPGSDPGDLYRPLSVDSPLLFPQAAGRADQNVNAGLPFPLTSGMTKGLLYVFPALFSNATLGYKDGVNSTVVPATYMKADGTTVAFPQVPGPNYTPTVQAIAPVLQLRFLLKPTPAVSTKRAPFNFSGSKVFGAGGAETLVAIIPTFGRKNIIIQCGSGVAGNTIRVAALRNTNNDALAPFVMQETTEGSKVVTVNNESTRFQLCDICADWTLIYMTPVGGSTPTYTITAYD